MSNKNNDLVHVLDSIGKAYLSNEQVKNLLRIASENYFCLNIENEERKKEWGVYSYKMVETLFNAIFDYSFDIHTHLTEALNSMNTFNNE